ncbi:MAG: nucleoside-diphosphate-sugar epimerase protein [Pseudomonadota bacterium]|jgi:nucleoside-diphosphate-sugar epimerase
MEVLITGGAGFLGIKLTRALLARGTLADANGQQQPITRILLLDRAAPQGLADPRISVIEGDVADPAVMARALTPSIASVFHLAAVVSGEAEADFELGMRVNLDATRLLLEQARHHGNRPRVVFASSVAAFGGELPVQVLDSTAPTPQGSYGIQKVIGELLVNDYSRRKFIDGRSIRLPTITVRPGKANKAASSFASGIVREPLNGIDAICPVPPETKVWVMSPRSAIANLVRAHEIDAGDIGTGGAISLPGLATTAGEMVAALARVAGDDVAKRVHWENDEAITRLVGSWPGSFLTPRADSLGFVRDQNFDDIVRAYIAEDMKR